MIIYSLDDLQWDFMEIASPGSIFKIHFIIPPSAIDQNGHVNNVNYIQWMQDIAVRHYEAMGGIQPTHRMGATWIVHSHRVMYHSPAFSGEEIEASTWVVNLRKVRSLRRYRFIRVSDGKLLVSGETEWVFVNVSSGKLMSIPEEIIRLFKLLDA